MSGPENILGFRGVRIGMSQVMVILGIAMDFGVHIGWFLCCGLWHLTRW